MDIFPLLDELQTIARNGLNYAENPYDRERYTRLMELVSHYYEQTLDLPAEEVKRRFAAEVGYITPKVGADAAIFDDEGRILLGNLSGPNSLVAVVYLCEVTAGELTLSHEGKALRYWFIEEVPSWHGGHYQYAVAARATCQVLNLLKLE
jgi:hypothetical protein